MGVSVSKYVSLMQRDNLLLLISLADPNSDFSQYEDDELVDVLYELYPQDVINSLKLTKNSFKGDMAILKDYVSNIKNTSSFIFAVQTGNDSVNLFWNFNKNSNEDVYVSCSEIKDGVTKDFYDFIVDDNRNSRTVIVPYRLKALQFFLYKKLNGKKNIISKSEVINLACPFYKDNEHYMDNLFFLPFLNKDGNFALNNIELKEEYEKYKSC